MSNVVTFARKTPASKLRVSEMAAEHGAMLNRAHKADEALAETERIRKMLLTELGLAFQKCYVLLGIEETDKIGPYAQSAKREEHIMKLKIKGSE